VIGSLVLSLAISATMAARDTSNSAGTGSATVAPDTSAHAAPLDSVSASHLRAAQEAWDKGPNTASKDAGASLSAGTLAGGLFQVLSGLAFLVLIAVAGLFVLRRVRGKSSFTSAGSMIDVLETAQAGPGRQICLVRIHDRVVAVAFAQSSAAAVAEFTGTSAAEILADSGNGRANVRDFSATLESFMERFRRQPPPSREAR